MARDPFRNFVRSASTHFGLDSREATTLLEVLEEGGFVLGEDRLREWLPEAADALDEVPGFQDTMEEESFRDTRVADRLYEGFDPIYDVGDEFEFTAETEGGSPKRGGGKR